MDFFSPVGQQEDWRHQWTIHYQVEGEQAKNRKIRKADLILEHIWETNLNN
jgi:hypothetical protein